MELTTEKRKKVKKWGLPKEKKYPMPDKSHARNAKARASEMYHKGKITKRQFEMINAIADRVLK